MPSIRSIYHRLIPERLRNPVGMARRRVADLVRRGLSRDPIPDRRRLAAIQLTPWASEYLEVGRRAARSIEQALAGVAIDSHTRARILDFGCGSARVLRHLRHTTWHLEGCDTDEEAVRWSRDAFPDVVFTPTAPRPPLPWEDKTFDAIYAVSVFTHFNAAEQRSWRDELHRILKPHGVLVLTTMGPSVIENFTDHSAGEHVATLARDGFLFRANAPEFNARAAFHTSAGLQDLFSPRFELLRWFERGLDGFQDLSVLRKR